MKSSEDEQIQALTKAVQAQIDTLVGQYDARVLATCFLARGAALLNSLRQLGITKPDEIEGIFIAMAEIVGDDTKPPPRVQTPPKTN